MKKTNMKKTLLSGAAVSTFILFLNKDKIKNKSDKYLEKIADVSGIPIEKIKQKFKPETWNNIEQITNILSQLIAEYAVKEQKIKYDILAKEIVKWTIYVGEKSTTIYRKKEVKQLLKIIDSPTAVDQIDKFLNLPNQLKKIAKASKLPKTKNLQKVVRHKLLTAIDKEFANIKTIKPKRRVKKALKAKKSVKTKKVISKKKAKKVISKKPKTKK